MTARLNKKAFGEYYECIQVQIHDENYLIALGPIKANLTKSESEGIPDVYSGGDADNINKYLSL